MSILLNSADISGMTTFKIELNYVLTNVSTSETIIFTLNIVDPYNSSGTKLF